MNLKRPGLQEHAKLNHIEKVSENENHWKFSEGTTEVLSYSLCRCVETTQGQRKNNPKGLQGMMIPRDQQCWFPLVPLEIFIIY
jgi:hypothetical protein